VRAWRTIGIDGGAFQVKESISPANEITHVGKRLRGELLIRLKDTAGLKYIEIIKLSRFHLWKLKITIIGQIVPRCESAYAK
jgi:hypothetical protein